MSENCLLGLDFAHSDIALVRSTLAAALLRTGLSEPARSALAQATLEAVSNAIVHGGGEGRLTVDAVHGEVRCEVTDQGPGPGAVVLPSGAATAGGGHGLRLAEALVGRLDVRPGPENRGTTVTLAVPLNGSPAR